MYTKVTICFMLYYFDSLIMVPCGLKHIGIIRVILLLLTLQPNMGFDLLHNIIPDSSIFDDLAPN